MWIDILNANKSSKLYLISNEFNDLIFKDKIVNIFKKGGIEEERLNFMGSFERLKLLNYYNKIDIVLDTFPYTGGTTTLEAIFMERPVLSVYGETFLTRCGLSINKNICMDDWVCKSFNEYREKAIEYSKNIDFLIKQKNKIKNNKPSSPLYNSKLFSFNLSKILKSLNS